MTVAELIAALSEMPQDAEVWLHWDGEPRSSSDAIWLARDGFVCISDLMQPVYSDSARPIDAPSAADHRYLYVHEMLGIDPPDQDDQ